MKIVAKGENYGLAQNFVHYGTKKLRTPKDFLKSNTNK